MASLVLDSFAVVFGNKAIVTIITSFAIGLGLLGTLIHLWKYKEGRS